VLPALFACEMRHAVAGADGPGVRVVGKGDACAAQLVDQACCLAWGGDLQGAVMQRLIVAAEEDGQGGQMRQDLVLTDIGVLRPTWFRTGGAGVAVAAPVGGPAGPRGAVASWAAMESASLTSAGCAGWREMTQPSGRFHRCTCLCPSPVLAGSTRSRSVRCRFHTCRPVYRGLARIATAVLSVQAVPARCGFRSGSAADGHGTPASFRARVIRAVLCPASL
jgi:hypothetical protein